MLKRVEVFIENGFNDQAMKNFLVHESPYMKVLNFNFKAGQELPVHSHDLEGQLTIAVTTQSTSSSALQAFPYSDAIMKRPEWPNLKHSEQLQFEIELLQFVLFCAFCHYAE